MCGSLSMLLYLLYFFLANGHEAQGSNYYVPLSTAKPRDACKRTSLPWNSVPEHNHPSFEPNTAVGSTRIRLYEKLPSYCCSFHIFNVHAGSNSNDESCMQYETDPIIGTEEWESDSEIVHSDGEDTCKLHCYTQYVKWVMGYALKPCLSAQWSLSPGFTRDKNRCDLFSEATSNRKCLLRPTSHPFTTNIEIKKQCIVNETGYETSVCEGSEIDSCYGQSKAFGTLFMVCRNKDHSIVVDSVQWVVIDRFVEENKKDFCGITEKHNYFNSRITAQGFPNEIEINMREVGTHLCGYNWMNFINQADMEKSPYTNEWEEARLHFNFHCSPIEDIEIPLTTPESFPISEMDSACEDIDRAFDPALKDSELSSCTKNRYATERVSTIFRCQQQCLGYYINQYNTKTFAHPGKSCRGVVVHENTDGFFQCELYDWDPHQKPSNIVELRGNGCQVSSGASGKHLYLLSYSCYAVATPPPGLWEVSTILPYLLLPHCEIPNTAFDPSFAATAFANKEINCEQARFWKKGRIPDRSRNENEQMKDYFEDYWDSGSENEALDHYYGRENVEENEMEILNHHCKLMCLQMQREYYITFQQRPCHAVAAVVMPKDKYHRRYLFCIFKTWPWTNREQCMTERADAYGINFNEFSLKEECYEPKDLLESGPVEDKKDARAYRHRKTDWNHKEKATEHMQGAEKFSQKWCKHKMLNIGKNTSNLSCIRKCKGLFPEIPKISENVKDSPEWCRTKLQDYKKDKPHLQCIRQCQTILGEGHQAMRSKPSGSLTPHYCQEKIQEHGQTKPHLSCIKKCRGLYPNLGVTPYKRYTVEWCQDKLETHGKPRPQLSCIGKCRTIVNHKSSNRTTQKRQRYSQEKQNRYGINYCAEIIREYGESKPHLSCVTKCLTLRGQ